MMKFRYFSDDETVTTSGPVAARQYLAWPVAGEPAGIDTFYMATRWDNSQGITGLQELNKAASIDL
jgi:hypothetical protein